MAQQGEGSGVTVARTSERDLVVSRTVRGPARAVWAAWTRAELFARWWVPASCPLPLVACELDVRVGGRYRLAFRAGDATMEVFGTYVEVAPPSRLAWTNEEGDAGVTITTVTFEERGAETRVVVHDRYPSREALDAALASGATSGTPESLDQLDAFLVGGGVPA